MGLLLQFPDALIGKSLRHTGQLCSCEVELQNYGHVKGIRVTFPAPRQASLVAPSVPGSLLEYWKVVIAPL